MIEAFPSPEARRIEEGETAGEGEKGREGRSQREIRRAACGLLGASQVELELANTGTTPVVPLASGIRGEKGMRVSARYRSNGPEELVYSGKCASLCIRIPMPAVVLPFAPVVAPLVPPGCDLTTDARTAQYKLAWLLIDRKSVV